MDERERMFMAYRIRVVDRYVSFWSRWYLLTDEMGTVAVKFECVPDRLRGILKNVYVLRGKKPLSKLIHNTPMMDYSTTERIFWEDLDKYEMIL